MLKKILFINKNANISIKSELKTNFKNYIPALSVFSIGMLFAFIISIGMFSSIGVLSLSRIIGALIICLLLDLIMFFGYVGIAVNTAKLSTHNMKNVYKGSIDHIDKLNDIIIFKDQSSQRVYQLIDSIETLNLNNQPYDNVIAIILKNHLNVDKILTVRDQLNVANLTIADKAIISANAQPLNKDQLYHYIENIKEFINTTQSISNDKEFNNKYNQYFNANMKYLNDPINTNHKVQLQLTDYINKENEFVINKTKESIDIIHEYESKNK